MIGKSLRATGGALVLGLVFTGCVERAEETRTVVASDDSTVADTVATRPQPAPPPDMRLEVDLSDRELYVYRNNERVESHPVAVGSEEWPTPTGEWTVDQVVWNPRWVPPEEEWAKEEEISEPGDPDNPLGKAQLVYQAPNSIHGTNEPESLGQPVSHGSIRVANEVAVSLARQVMEAGGAGRDEAFYRNAQANTTERIDVAIPNPVPIRVVE